MGKLIIAKLLIASMIQINTASVNCQIVDTKDLGYYAHIIIIYPKTII